MEKGDLTMNFSGFDMLVMLIGILSYKVFRGFNQILGCEFLKNGEFVCLESYLVQWPEFGS